LGRDFFTHVAEHEGKIAGANAVLPAALRRTIDYRPLPWVTFCDPEIGHVGFPAPNFANAENDSRLTMCCSTRSTAPSSKAKPADLRV
jgi:pyruvate/2-oxoglutarate dehydrogenase complex dihydrolipoamide dehydrogenase (E3) component